jgi:hypothetical protein
LISSPRALAAPWLIQMPRQPAGRARDRAGPAFLLAVIARPDRMNGEAGFRLLRRLKLSVERSLAGGNLAAA